MARTQFTFTFTNAQPGSVVSFDDGVLDHLYADATSSTRVGRPLVLNSSNALSVWSDVETLTATTEDGVGNDISATATRGNPSVATDDGTAGQNPFSSGGSSSVDAISAESPGTINGGGNVDAWTVDVAAGTSITQAGDTFTLAAGVYFMQALVIGDVTADISFPHLGLAVVGFDAGLQSSGAADAAGGKVYQQMFAVGAAFDLQIAGVATPTYVGLDLFRIGSLTP